MLEKQEMRKDEKLIFYYDYFYIMILVSTINLQ